MARFSEYPYLAGYEEIDCGPGSFSDRHTLRDDIKRIDEVIPINVMERRVLPPDDPAEITTHWPLVVHEQPDPTVLATAYSHAIRKEDIKEIW